MVVESKVERQRPKQEGSRDESRVPSTWSTRSACLDPAEVVHLSHPLSLSRPRPRRHHRTCRLVHRECIYSAIFISIFHIATRAQDNAAYGLPIQRRCLWLTAVAARTGVVSVWRRHLWSGRAAAAATATTTTPTADGRTVRQHSAATSAATAAVTTNGVAVQLPRAESKSEPEPVHTAGTYRRIIWTNTAAATTAATDRFIVRRRGHTDRWRLIRWQYDAGGHRRKLVWGSYHPDWLWRRPIRRSVQYRQHGNEHEQHRPRRTLRTILDICVRRRSRKYADKRTEIADTEHLRRACKPALQATYPANVSHSLIPPLTALTEAAVTWGTSPSSGDLIIAR